MFPEIIIAGSGNVATQLSLALHDAGYSISICSTNAVSGKVLADRIGAPFYLPESLPATFDLAIIATQDDRVIQAATSLSGKASIMVHTSGTLPSLVLRHHAAAYGVFYPLQTIRKEVNTDWTKVPVCIYATTQALNDILQEMAEKIAAKPYAINDEQRSCLHVAAVLVNNFTHHLAVKAKAFTTQHSIDFSILHPLIAQTAENIFSEADLAAFQTGPAARGDTHTLERHMQLIRDSGDEQLAVIYDVLSKSILQSRSV
jgi:predicted short-subunit dehydrogenase-like oxidoreductase (DUF2520 family)